MKITACILWPCHLLFVRCVLIFFLIFSSIGNDLFAGSCAVSPALQRSLIGERKNFTKAPSDLTKLVQVNSLLGSGKGIGGLSKKQATLCEAMLLLKEAALVAFRASAPLSLKSLTDNRVINSLSSSEKEHVSLLWITQKMVEEIKRHQELRTLLNDNDLRNSVKYHFDRVMLTFPDDKIVRSFLADKKGLTRLFVNVFRMIRPEVRRALA